MSSEINIVDCSFVPEGQSRSVMDGGDHGDVDCSFDPAGKKDRKPEPSAKPAKPPGK